eukprot:CAMPEP_0181190406 /NCGR_PEP_ID=MMETSP1096-20121128/12176_1 /TAXON_ID=156174 ORGANISM="Chrysochromulina ericina, Strain CCMP281" /NCGR_SAMPLE_ID=MMETSP1096 /ASSEMBLY_ACC=CAM_ASM_000453 /LENGTH=142 /DNA_ID=CAMNT_0023279619 /DNA_START=45 /DNA_END=473 /DNA_ORIENTATION=+
MQMHHAESQVIRDQVRGGVGGWRFTVLRKALVESSAQSLIGYTGCDLARATALCVTVSTASAPHLGEVAICCAGNDKCSLLLYERTTGHRLAPHISTFQGYFLGVALPGVTSAKIDQDTSSASVPITHQNFISRLLLTCTPS